MSTPFDSHLPNYLTDEFGNPLPSAEDNNGGGSVFGSSEPVEVIPEDHFPTPPQSPGLPTHPTGSQGGGALPTGPGLPSRPVGPIPASHPAPPAQGAGAPRPPLPQAPVTPSAPVAHPTAPAPVQTPVGRPPVPVPAAPVIPEPSAARSVEPRVVEAAVVPVAPSVPSAGVSGLPVREPVTRPTVPVPVPATVSEPDEFDEYLADEDEVEEHAGKRKAPAKVGQGTSPRLNRPRTKKGTGSSRKGPMLVTERDRLVMQTLARYRFATLEHIRRVMDTSEDMARRRLNRMEDSGYIKSYRIEHNGTRLLAIAENGLAYLNSSLSAPRFTIKSLGHTLAATDIGLQFEAHGETVVTEREIRAMDLRGLRPGATFDMDELNSDEMYTIDPVTGTPVLDPEKAAQAETLNRYRSWAMVTNRDGRGFTKIPDLVLDRPVSPDGQPNAIAVEVELTLKSQPSEYEALLRAYAASGRYAKVLYLTPDKSVRRYVQEAVEKLHLEGFVEIRKFVPSAHLPGYSGHVARGRGRMDPQR